VSLGNGNGTFTTASDFPAQTSKPGIIASQLEGADYNCDNNPDIAVTSPTDNIVQVLSGNGNGTFNGALPFSVGTTPSGLTSSDFDNQNGPDLATSNFSSNNISVRLNASPNCGSSTNSNLTLTKTDSPDPVKVGHNLTYTLTLTNNGPNTSGVTITDALPAGVTFVSASSGCTNTSNTVTCNVGSLANGATVTEQIVVQVNQAGTLTNTANAQSSLNPTPVTDTATTTAQTNPNRRNNYRNNYRNGLFHRFFRHFFNPQYGNQYGNGQYGNNEGTGSTSTATGQYEGTSPGNGVSASAGPGGTSPNAGGTSAYEGNPDTQPPVSGPQGEVVPTVDTGGEPLPPTGGISLWKLASLVGITLAPLVGLALVGSSRYWIGWMRRRRCSSRE
jgi:uncharacterized repeat protein (TIGR01451 family)